MEWLHNNASTDFVIQDIKRREVNKTHNYLSLRQMIIILRPVHPLLLFYTVILCSRTSRCSTMCFEQKYFCYPIHSLSVVLTDLRKSHPIDVKTMDHIRCFNTVDDLVHVEHRQLSRALIKV